MAIVELTGEDSSEAEINDVVSGSVDFNGRPSYRSKSGSWKSASFIIGVEVAERFAYCGISSNMITYLTGPMGQSTAVAAANLNAWTGATMLLTLLGAFVADAFLGRYRTIIIASVLYVMGLGFLSLSAAIHSSNFSNCENQDCSSVLEVVVFYFSLYLVAFAQGGHKPCVQAFGADQFDEKHENELIAKSSFFNWWYFSMNGGVIVAQLVLNYIQENLSWELGFGIPSLLMCFALIIFLLGTTTYRFRRSNNGKNPFVRIGSVFVIKARNFLRSPSSANVADEGELQFQFLENASAVSTDTADAEELLRLVPIWASCLGYAIVTAQSATLFTKQGATMDRSIAFGLKIPAASLLSLSGLSIAIFIPFYDRVLVPIARAVTKKPTGITMLQRIGTGIVLSIVYMVIAAVIERWRIDVAIEHGLVDEAGAMVPMSVWWLAPQYLLLGVSEVFTLIGLQEFMYDQMPNDLKSVGLALYLSIFGVGSFLSSFLISIIESITSRDGRDGWFSDNLNRGHLDYFYWLLVGMTAVSFVAYVYFAKSYVYKMIRQK